VKALSVRQPWAWLICTGYKDIENREWSSGFKGRVYIHAGKMVDWHSQIAMLRGEIRIPYRALKEMSKQFLALGAIIGEVDIADCVTESTSPWFTGPFGFVLRNPQLYEKSIPCKGRLGFFEPSSTTEGGGR